MAPAPMTLSMEPSVTPRPTCAALAPAKPADDCEPPRSVCWSWSRNVVRPPLKPTVLTLARSLAATSSITCWVFRPETAENMLRIMGASPSLGSPASSREVQPGLGSVLSEDCGIDVGEDVLAHRLRVDRRDHGLVL